jgi:hypothetical protein
MMIAVTSQGIARLQENMSPTYLPEGDICSAWAKCLG